MNLDSFKPVYAKPDDAGAALTPEDYLAGTKHLIDESLKEKMPYRTPVAGREFIVYPNVFSPKYFKDTEAFAVHLPVKEREEMLEIGPGTGAVSITALYRGAKKVTAIDVNPDAVKNTQANIELHGMQDRMEVRKGDVYSAVKRGEKFDSIFWNTPFAYVSDTTLPDLEKAVSDPLYRSTERFIKEAQLHLKDGGRVLIGFSTTLGRLDLLQRFCDQADLDLQLLYEEQSEEVHPVKFEIFEAKPKEQK
jgi:release factor glutamine methyltransferase